MNFTPDIIPKFFTNTPVCYPDFSPATLSSNSYELGLEHIALFAAGFAAGIAVGTIARNYFQSESLLKVNPSREIARPVKLLEENSFKAVFIIFASNNLSPSRSHQIDTKFLNPLWRSHQIDTKFLNPLWRSHQIDTKFLNPLLALPFYLIPTSTCILD